MARKPQESAEDRLIGRYFKPIATHPGAFGLRDDAAVLTPPAGHDLVLKTDAIVGGVHFFHDDPAAAVAQKALRVNLSDLAAKGAKPAGCLLSLALPKGTPPGWLKGFARGLAADVKRYQCPLFGGDTDRTPGPVTVSFAVFGTLPKGSIVTRMGAKVGDIVVVSGTIGDAALGLKLRLDRSAARRWRLNEGMRRHLASRYLLPRPRNALAEAVRKFANGSMDVSDGLVGDLTKLGRASGVGAEVDAGRVPLSAAGRVALKADATLLETMLTGGDDFEIIATVPPRRLDAFQAAARKAGVAVTPIGRIVKGSGTRFLGPDGKVMRFARLSYSHF